MSEEIFPIVEPDGTIVGKAPRSSCHNGSMLLHPVIHLHVFNSKGELMVQKRSADKEIAPNLWDSSVAGHISYGESPEKAAEREAWEEIGLENPQLHFIASYPIETLVEKELNYCYYCLYDGDFKLDAEEVADYKFMTIDEIKNLIGKRYFTINFEQDFLRFLSKGIEGLPK